MPLSVDIRLNGRILETVWIGRLEDFADEEAEHKYVCGIGTEYNEAWNMPGVRMEDLPTFTHRYSDGARECVRRALKALQEFDEFGRRPRECCGECPPIVGGGYDCTCKDNPNCRNYGGAE